MVKHEILDLSKDSYYDLSSDLLYIEVGLQKLLYRDIFVMGGNKYGLLLHEDWNEGRGCYTTDSRVGFIFYFKKRNYCNYKDICLRVIYENFRNSDVDFRMKECLKSRFGLTKAYFSPSDSKVYVNEEGLYNGMIMYDNLGMKEVKRLKGIIDDSKDFRSGIGYFSKLVKRNIVNDLCSKDCYYNKVLSYLVGNLESHESYLVKIIGRGTLNPTIYIGHRDIDIDMIKYNILKYLPVDRVEIAKMDDKAASKYRITLEITENEFLSIFHDLYMEDIITKKSLAEIRMPCIL